jgi:hypothetical protein
MKTLSRAKQRPTRTRFLKSVKIPSATMFKPGGNNKKLGSKITTGAWDNAAIYSLTLEERNSCPTDCEQWDTCYGNNMPFATRYDHTHPTFYSCLEQNLSDLINKHIWSKDQPIALRLHVLGDFFSKEYVEWWQAWLFDWYSVKVWGYTHHDPQSEIGEAISRMNEMDNCYIRFSDSKFTAPMNLQANVIASESERHTGLICPEQRGIKLSCGDCAMCWTSNRAINFLQH